MDLNILIKLLAWSTVLNYAVLLLWVLILILAKKSLYKLHGLWFNISAEKFDALHYMGIAIYKILIILFNLVPYLVLRFLV